MSLNDDVDGWVAQLMQCKPLSEGEVKKLCEKVSYLNPMYWYGGVMCDELVMMFEPKDNGVGPSRLDLCSSTWIELIIGPRGSYGGI
jgi:hypothetical protein